VAISFAPEEATPTTDAIYRGRPMKPKLYCVVSPDGFPSWPEPFVGMAAARREKARFIERYRDQGHYAADGRRIPLGELEREVRIEPWGGEVARTED
jgi:hypothetical protein